MKKWTREKLYEHPAGHSNKLFGKVVLDESGTYTLLVGGTEIPCSQEWAARIHREETNKEEVTE